MEVEAYINQFDEAVRRRLLAIRELVRTEAPNAIESFSYGLVGYKLNKKPLVYFGGFKNHVGFYATPNGHEAFKEEFSKYKQGKGSVQFPNNQSLPMDLIKRVVEYRKIQVSDAIPYIGSPAKGALDAIGVKKASQLKNFTEKGLLALHGIGPKAIRMLRETGVKLKEEK